MKNFCYIPFFMRISVVCTLKLLHGIEGGGDQPAGEWQVRKNVHAVKKGVVTGTA